MQDNRIAAIVATQRPEKRMVKDSVFLVLGEFTIDAGDRGPLIEALLENRRDTLASEPGCRSYDVCTPEDRNDRVFMVEVYDSQDAFEAHKNTPHFARWHEAAHHLIKETKVVFLNRHLTPT
jgi:quinol monooxygenase YgiN